MFPPLPQAPPPPQAIMGHQGSQLMPPPGTQGFQQNPAAQIADGLNKFMTSYFGSKDALQQHYSEKASKALTMIQQGLVSPKNADMEKIMGWMKKADWPVRTEAPTPQEAQFLQQQDQYDRAQQQLSQTPPSDMPTSAASLGAAPSSMQQMLMQEPPQPPPQAPPPGFLDRLKGMVGMSQAQRAPTSIQSPTGQYLQALAQASQAGAPMNPANIQASGNLSQTQGRISQLMANIEEKTGVPLHQAGANAQGALLNLAAKARTGDPQAIDMAVRSGVMKNVGIDEIASIYSHVAPPGTDPQEIYAQAGKTALFAHVGLPMMKMQQEWAEKLVPRFASSPDPVAASRAYVQASVDGQTPPVRPGMTMEELKTQNDAMEGLLKAYPTMPMSYVNAWNIAKLTGDTSAQSKIAGLMSKLPRDGTIKNTEFQQTHSLAEFTAKSDVALKTNQLQLSIIDTALKAAGQEGEEIKMELNSKDSEVQARGFERLKNLDLKESQIKIPVPNPSDPSHPLLYQVKDPVQVVGQATGWLGRNLLGRTETHLAPITAPNVPNQSPPSFPPPSRPYDLPDPFEGLPPELREVVQMMSHPKGERDPVVQKWFDEQRKLNTGQ